MEKREDRRIEKKGRGKRGEGGSLGDLEKLTRILLMVLTSKDLFT